MCAPQYKFFFELLIYWFCLEHPETKEEQKKFLTFYPLNSAVQMIGYFVEQNDMIFGEKNFVGSRIRTYEPRCPRFEEPRSRISQEPQRVGGWDLIDLTRSLGARGFLGSGALDHSAIPTHVDSQILQEGYLAR